jgi:type I restriction enzyme S subunit
MANNLTLADAVVSANTGLDAIKRAPIVEEDTGIKCLRIQDVNQEKDFVSWGNTLVEKRNFKKFQLKENDILIARTGGSVGANRYIYRELQAVYNNGLIRIRANIKKHNPKFIYYRQSSLIVT